MPTLDPTVGGASSNTYETLAEAQAYFDSRLPLSGWDDADDQTVLLTMATRVLDMMAVPHRTLRKGCDCNYYYTSRAWTGAPASSTQKLAWPRIGMFDRNGNPIPSNVIPQELKDAESELAGQLGSTDTTLDNATIVGGIKSVRAGSVAVEFKDVIEAHVLPDAVLNLMPASWFTDELVEPALRALFNVIS